MPCTTLSSGKTVCFGDDNKSTRNQPIPKSKPATIKISQEVLQGLPQFKTPPQQGGTISATEDKSFNLLDVLDVPQKVMMKALTTEYVKPSQFMANRNLGTDDSRLAADLLLDPLNLLPVAKGVQGLKGDQYLNRLEQLYNAARKYGLRTDNTEDIISGTNFSTPQYPDGGKTLKVKGSSFNIPKSQQQILAEQARTQGDTPTPSFKKTNVVVSQKRLPESGVVVDKRTNTAVVIPDNKPAYTFPVLTAKNPEANSNPWTVDQLAKHPEFRGTPTGYYTFASTTNPHDLSEYDNNIRRLNPISAFGQYAPNSLSVAMHQTYDPATRGRFYDMPSDKRFVSYGCINCRKEDAQRTFGDIPLNDTILILDSKNQSDNALFKQAQSKVKKDGGKNVKTITLSTGKVVTLK